MDTSIDDPAYRAAVTDLLGVLAYGELSASLRMAADGVLAPSLAIQAGIARLAAADYRHYEVLVGRMQDLGIDAEAAMQPFVAPFTGFHERNLDLIRTEQGAILGRPIASPTKEGALS